MPKGVIHNCPHCGEPCDCLEPHMCACKNCYCPECDQPREYCLCESDTTPVFRVRMEKPNGSLCKYENVSARWAAYAMTEAMRRHDYQCNAVTCEQIAGFKGPIK